MEDERIKAVLQKSAEHGNPNFIEGGLTSSGRQVMLLLIRDCTVDLTLVTHIHEDLIPFNVVLATESYGPLR